MFSESLLDGKAGDARRGWSVLFAWMAEAGLVALTVILPLMYTEAIPHLVSGRATSIGPPPGERPHGDSQPVRHSGAAKPSPYRLTELVTPGSVPRGTDTTPDRMTSDVADAPPCLVCVPGGLGDPNRPGTDLLARVMPQPAQPPEPPKPVPTRVARSGGVIQGYLLRQVQPVYPRLAITTRQEGQVVLSAVINRDGTIGNLHAVSGPPMLVGAAIDAVRQWRYRPYLLNGQPVEVETQITVNFTLAKN